jgi:hypothetical protein
VEIPGQFSVEINTLMLERNNKQIMFRMIAWMEGHIFNSPKPAK